MDVESWTCKDVAKWLSTNGFGQYSRQLCTDHMIDGQALLLLTEADLRSPPVSLNVLGDIKRLIHQIDLLKRHIGNQGRISNGFAPTTSTARVTNQNHVGADEVDQPKKHLKHLATRLEPEVFKTVLSIIYVTLVFLLTAFVLTVVHDRVPDMEKYPPLPDIVLDSIPLIPWAFQACELCGIILAVLCFLVLFLHKHRYLAMRRLFAIAGTVFLLRCVTMFVTSLSVPGIHLQCSAKVYGTVWDKLSRAVEICLGLGMSLTGVHTCGDYMFSGHTTCITLANFFITEYSPRKFHILHTATWVINLFGIFFILAGHEHYTIDVFIAFYITSRLFLYYHTLANNRALRQGDERVRVWFPMFSFFEANVDGIVPNEYEFPLPSLTKIMERIRECPVNRPVKRPIKGKAR
ncbi:sphingomyelin synthase-related protein 1-like [Lytechinus variegatus]|uniref:sphingomyelin synthase-related protein 1-like n=1 Tax=Lytechinus variegatus TaxID=7654 RepID=UPI001BB1734C|nr:sphingomyelin synthase-related protein 1-like [Lytechinus variegatus]